MDGISRSRGWDKEIPHGVLPMEQLVLSDKWARISCPYVSVSFLRYFYRKYHYSSFKMSGKDIDDMTFDKFKFWTVSSLKDFLRRRNLSGIGNKEMLVARSFAAFEMKIPETESSSKLLESWLKNTGDFEAEIFKNIYSLSVLNVKNKTCAIFAHVS